MCRGKPLVYRTSSGPRWTAPPVELRQLPRSFLYLNLIKSNVLFCIQFNIIFTSLIKSILYVSMSGFFAQKDRSKLNAYLCTETTYTFNRPIIFICDQHIFLFQSVLLTVCPLCILDLQSIFIGIIYFNGI